MKLVRVTGVLVGFPSRIKLTRSILYGVVNVKVFTNTGTRGGYLNVRFLSAGGLLLPLGPGDDSFRDRSLVLAVADSQGGLRSGGIIFENLAT